MDKEKRVIKVILLGESGVGKTNLINVSIGLNFNESVSATLSNNFVEKIFTINHKNYYLHLWDTIGQERFRLLTKIFFKNSKIVILVYDKSKRESFEELKYWNNEVNEALDEEFVTGVVGNKEDLDDNKDDVNEDEGREYAKSINARFRMVSAKLNPNGFQSFLKELLIDYIDKSKNGVPDRKSFLLGEKEATRKKSKSC